MMDEDFKVKPIMGMMGDHFLKVDLGKSVSNEAEEGVAVEFSYSFLNPPVVVIGQHQEKETWIDPDSITVNGFTWYATQEEAGVDWIAIGI